MLLTGDGQTFSASLVVLHRDSETLLRQFCTEVRAFPGIEVEEETRSDSVHGLAFRWHKP